MGSDEHIVRLRTGEYELGVTDALQRIATRHVVQPKPISAARLAFEHRRPRWLRECVAEATGVFIYVYPGIAAIASFTIHAESPLGTSAFGSLFQIGFAFALGISFAILVCAPTSGGHFHPGITVCLAVWQGFPLRKVPHYIASQIFGSFMAGLLLMGTHWEQISEMKAELLEKGMPIVANGAPASILCSFPNPNQTNLGFVCLIEIIACFFVGVIIFACIDPANPFVSPTTAPFAIGMAYAAMVWGFGDVTISLNMARDLGCRIVAAIFFGREAFTYMNYSPIAILLNIPATFLGTAYYELFLKDSVASLSKGHVVHEDGEEGLKKFITRTEHSV